MIGISPDEIGIFAIVIFSLFLVPAIVQILWNRTIPEVFGLTTITFWQSFRLTLLCWILFGSYPSTGAQEPGAVVAKKTSSFE